MYVQNAPSTRDPSLHTRRAGDQPLRRPMLPDRPSARRNSKSMKGNSGASSARHASLPTPSIPPKCSTLNFPKATPPAIRARAASYCTPPILSVSMHNTSKLEKVGDLQQEGQKEGRDPL